MKRMRLITGEPYGFTGICASARWSGAPALAFDHVVAGAANAMVAVKATAQRPLGFGGSTG